MKNTVSDGVKVFDTLQAFTEYVALLDERAQKLKAYLDGNKASAMLFETVKDAIESASLDVERIEFFVEDLEVIDIRDIKYKTYIISIYNEENVAKVSVEANCKVKVYYKYTDEDESYYDKEDHTYLWQKIVELEDTYEVNVDLTVSLDITDCGVDVEEDDEFVEFIEYIDVPERIDLEEDALLECEELS